MNNDPNLHNSKSSTGRITKNIFILFEEIKKNREIMSEINRDNKL